MAGQINGAPGPDLRLRAIVCRPLIIWDAILLVLLKLK